MLLDLSTGELIALVSPLVIIQYGLAIFCLTKIIKQGVANLNRIVWGIIVFCVQFVGPAVFLLFGRRKDI